MKIEHIQEAVARHFRLPRERMIMRGRLPVSDEARRIAMYLARQTGLSYPVIGKAFHRNHETVMSAVSRVNCKMAQDVNYRDLVESIRTTLGTNSIDHLPIVVLTREQEDRVVERVMDAISSRLIQGLKVA